eukprot:TRINITY_DN4949_c0_g1_i1.p1 TRINITY_DN4949_c0_g1~~TRINITY_DN4949_c0_g1_i1.p1  ORF type:complete len:4263 (+),score=1213.53 TRINITY_DN4949_c0_g1_i1:1567-12789(+)
MKEYQQLQHQLPPAQQQQAPEPPTLASMTRSSHKFADILEAIELVVDSSFKEADVYAQHFKEFQSVYEFGLNWRVDKYRGEEPDLQHFQSELIKFREWTADMERIQTSASRGILFIDSKTLKNALLPIPQKAMEDLKTLISSLAAERTQSLLNLFKNATKQLSTEPTSLPEFVDFVEFVKPLPAKANSCTKDIQLNDDMYALLEYFETAISSAEMERRSLIHTIFGRFKESLQQAQKLRKKFMPTYVKQLEKFISQNNASLEAVNLRLESETFSDPSNTAKAMLLELADIRTQVTELKQKADRYAKWQEILDLPISSVAGINQTIARLTKTEMLWSTADMCHALFETYNSTPFTSLKKEDIDTNLNAVVQQATNLLEEDHANPVANSLIKQVAQYIDILPMVLELANPAIKPRHWARLFEAVNQPYDEETVFTLHQLVEYKLFAHKDLISEVSELASGEFLLETTLHTIEKTWETKKLTLVPYTNKGTSLQILAGVEELLALLEDHELTLANMLHSPYISEILKPVETIKTKLAHVSQVLEAWLSCQHKWESLEPIFALFEVQRQLSAQNAKFHVIDRRWKTIMRTTNRDPHVLSATSNAGLLPMLLDANTSLNVITASLAGYLDDKRQECPRLYFLSNKELLHALGHDLQITQSALVKCFDHIQSFDCHFKTGEGSSHEVVGMVNGKGERLVFTKPVSVGDHLEAWLGTVAAAMRKSVNDTLARAIFEFSRTPLEKFIFLYPIQIVCLVVLINWTQRVQLCVEQPDTAAALQDLSMEQGEHMQVLCSMAQDTALPAAQLFAVSTLTVVAVHCASVVAELSRQKTFSPTMYLWVKHVRYFWDANRRQCFVKHAGQTLEYGLEYLGSPSRLVLTGAVESAAVSITATVCAGFGCAVAGSNGVGKTAVIRDLAKALGRMCCSYNCSASTNLAALSHFLLGSVQSGVWGIMEHFETMRVEVLSVLAHHLNQISDCLSPERSGTEANVTLFGRPIRPDKNFGIFGTFSPATSETLKSLPHNLQKHFRPVSLVQTDTELIFEVLLLGQGFQHCDQLASKLYAIFTMMSSLQDAESSLISVALCLKRVKHAILLAAAYRRQYATTEREALVHALRLLVLPSYSQADAPTFLVTLDQVFPAPEEEVPPTVLGTPMPSPSMAPSASPSMAQLTAQQPQGQQQTAAGAALAPKSPALAPTQTPSGAPATTSLAVVAAQTTAPLAGTGPALTVTPAPAAGNGTGLLGEEELALRGLLRNAQAAQGLQPVEYEIEKAVQLYDTMLMYHAVILAGGSGSGKTAAYRLLAQALPAMTTIPKASVFCDEVRVLPINMASVSLPDALGQPAGVASSQPPLFEYIFSLMETPFTPAPMREDWALHNSSEPPTVVPTSLQQEASKVNRQTWLVFDGPVLSPWISRIHTVLGPMKTLTLTNGDTVSLPKDTRILFEIERLAFATPGMLSHCGIVMFNAPELGWRAWFASWLQRLSLPLQPKDICEQAKQRIAELFEAHVEPALDVVATCISKIPAVGSLSLVESMCAIMQGLLASPEVGSKLLSVLSLIFAFALIWSMGSVLDDEDKQQFEQWIKANLVDVYQFDPQNSVFDYGIDFEFGQAVHWSQTKKPPCSAALVPTVDTIRYDFVTQLLVSQGRHILFVGPPGIGKTAIIQSATSQLDPEKYDLLSVQLSAETTTEYLQDVLKTKLSPLRKNALGPTTVGKKVILCVEDVERISEEHNFMCTELLYEIIEHQRFFDSKSKTYVGVRGVQVIASITPGPLHPPCEGYYVSGRLLNRFDVFHLSPPSTTSLKSIIFPILRGFLLPFSSSELLRLVQPLTDASLVVFNKVREHLRPKVGTEHYAFNLSQLLDVFRGMLQLSPDEKIDLPFMVRFWKHETLRVYRDRLVTAADRDVVYSAIKEAINECFKLKAEEVNLVMDGVLFGCFSSHARGEDYREYKIPDFRSHLQVALEQISEGQVEKFDAGIVFLRSTLEHISHLSRSLSLPGGHALLLGSEGSGRYTILKLVSKMSGFQMITISTPEQYDDAEFTKTIKETIVQAVTADKCYVIMIEDTHFGIAPLMRRMDSLLNCGNIPLLFTDEEEESIVKELRPHALAAGRATTATAVLDFFHEFIKSNLHVVFSVNPFSPHYLDCIRMYPAIARKCTVDWYGPMNEEEAYEVAKTLLIRAGHTELPELESICQLLVAIFFSVVELSGKYFTGLNLQRGPSSRTFVSSVNLWVELSQKRMDHTEKKCKQLRTVIDRFSHITQIEDLTKKELESVKPVLLKVLSEVSRLQEAIDKNSKVVEEFFKAVRQEEISVNAKDTEAAILTKEAKQAQEQFDQIAMALSQATSVMASLSKAEVMELKKELQGVHPNDRVVRVMEALCIVKGIAPSVESAVTIFDHDFSWMIDYDKEHVKKDIISALKKYVINPDFSTSAIDMKAAKALCSWVLAIYKFATVFEVAEPKRLKTQEASRKLETGQKKLKDQRDALTSVEKRLSTMNKVFKTNTEKKEMLEQKEKELSARLVRCAKLIQHLKDEEGRWAEELEKCNERVGNVYGNNIFAAACTCYLGPFPSHIRQQLVVDWKMKSDQLKIQNSIDNQLQELADPTFVSEWKKMGLHVDMQSLQNSFIITHADRWPLIIDPHGIGKKWVKNFERANQLKVVRVGRENWLRDLENAVSQGRPALVKNFGVGTLSEGLLTALYALVHHVTITDEAGNQLIKLSPQSQYITYNKKFRLYITTKLSTEQLPQEIASTMTIANFHATPEGIEDQLLFHILRHERPDIQSQKDTLADRTNSDSRESRELEEKILEVLNSTEGDILENESAVAALEASKLSLTEMRKRLEVSVAAQATLDAVKESYRPTAAHASQLFHVLSGFSKLSPTRQYSLKRFLSLFQTILTAAPPPSLQPPQLPPSSSSSSSSSSQLPPSPGDAYARSAALHKKLVLALYFDAALGVPYPQRLLLAFQFAVAQQKSTGSISEVEWNYFIGKSIFLDDSQVLELLNKYSNLQPWVNVETWREVVKLDSQVIPDFLKYFTTYVNEWAVFYSHGATREAVPPLMDAARFSYFQRLLITIALAKHHFLPEVTAFVNDVLGLNPADVSFDAEAVAAASTESTPVVFHIAGGGDPADEVADLAAQRKQAEKLAVVPLGDANMEQATHVLKEAVVAGSWVVLQNCQAAPQGWIDHIEDVMDQGVEAAMAHEVHADFRLWLTTPAQCPLPPDMVFKSIHVFWDRPQSVKRSLQDTYCRLPESVFGTCKKPALYKRVAFALALFHAVARIRMQHRGGWLSGYDDMGDNTLQLSLLSAKMYLNMCDETQSDVSYVELCDFVVEAVYDGFFGEQQDREVAVMLMRDVVSTMFPSTFFGEGDSDRTPEYSLGLDQSLENFIESLPQQDALEALGMSVGEHHAAAKQAAADAFVQDAVRLATTLPAGVSGGRFIVEDRIQELKSFIPSAIPLDKDSKLHEDSLLSDFLLAECKAHNKLVTSMRRSLDLLLACDTEPPPRRLLMLRSSILKSEVPLFWRSLWPFHDETEDLQHWLAAVDSHVSFFRSWVLERPQSYMQLNSFFRPQLVLNGILLRQATAAGCSVDELTLKLEVMQDFATGAPASPPPDGLYLAGFCVQNASWDSNLGCLIQESAYVSSAQQPPATPVDAATAAARAITPPPPPPPALTSEMPLILCKAVRRSVEMSQPEVAPTYCCPVYRVRVLEDERSKAFTTTFERLAINVDLPVGKLTVSQCTRSGIKLFLR